MLRKDSFFDVFCSVENCYLRSVFFKSNYFLKRQNEGDLHGKHLWADFWKHLEKIFKKLTKKDLNFVDWPEKDLNFVFELCAREKFRMEITKALN